MTRKEKVEAIYKQYPDFADDDKKLLLYVFQRQGLALSDEQKQFFLDHVDNPEHWTRAARLVRQEHPELVSEKVKEARAKEFVEYKYNAKPQTAVDNKVYIGDDGYEYIKL
jgi:hypothetical protein